MLQRKPLVTTSLLVLSVLFLYLFRNFTVDDAFISWSHGKNLVEHGVYAFNVTGQRTEGATSPFVGLVSVLPALFNIDVVLFFKLFTVLVVIAFVIAVWKLTGQWKLAFLALFLTTAGPVQATHVWSGLETYYLVSVATCLIVACTSQLLIPTRFVIFLACLTIFIRVEFLLLVLVAVFIYFRRSKKLDSELSVVKSLAVFLAPLCLFGIIGATRFLYFGSFISQSSSTKTPISTFLNPLDLLTMILSFLRMGFGHPFEMFAAFSVCLFTYWRKKEICLDLFLITIAQIGLWFIYTNSHLEMNFANRFQYQTFWPIVVAGIINVRPTELFDKLMVVGVWTILLLQVSLNETRELITYYPRLSTSHGLVGNVIEKCSNSKAWIIGNDAGLVSYLTSNYYFDVNFLGTSSGEGYTPAFSKIDSSDAIVVGLSEPFVERANNLNYLSYEKILFHSEGYIVAVRFISSINPYLERGLLSTANIQQVANLRESNQLVRGIMQNYWRVPTASGNFCPAN